MWCVWGVWDLNAPVAFFPMNACVCSSCCHMNPPPMRVWKWNRQQEHTEGADVCPVQCCPCSLKLVIISMQLLLYVLGLMKKTLIHTCTVEHVFIGTHTELCICFYFSMCSEGLFSHIVRKHTRVQSPAGLWLGEGTVFQLINIHLFVLYCIFPLWTVCCNDVMLLFNAPKGLKSQPLSPEVEL